MKFAYADPPYLGQSRHYDHPQAAYWDYPHAHQDLIRELVEKYPDGWAMSLSSPSLSVILPYAPKEARIAAWVKPFHAYKRGVRPAYAWEPVIFCGGRNTGHPPPVKGEKATTPKDFIAENITLQKGLTGAKPLKFCLWILDLLNYQSGDTLEDLFPGSGIMAEAIAIKEADPTQLAMNL